MSSSSETQLQNLLSSVTDALLSGRSVDPLTREYDVHGEHVDGLLDVIRRLHTAMTGVQPSRRFVRRLRIELVGETDRNLVTRIRYLPPRVQVAAGVALVAGLIILRRRADLHAAKEVTAV
jgi:hypothetical protein